MSGMVKASYFPADQESWKDFQHNISRACWSTSNCCYVLAQSAIFAWDAILYADLWMIGSINVWTFNVCFVNNLSVSTIKFTITSSHKRNCAEQHSRKEIFIRTWMSCLYCLFSPNFTFVLCFTHVCCFTIINEWMNEWTNEWIFNDKTRCSVEIVGRVDRNAKKNTGHGKYGLGCLEVDTACRTNTPPQFGTQFPFLSLPGNFGAPLQHYALKMTLK